MEAQTFQVDCFKNVLYKHKAVDICNMLAWEVQYRVVV